MEAVDHFLAFFLSLMGARDVDGTTPARPDKAKKKRSTAKEALD
jgi:hypothetical protein